MPFVVYLNGVCTGARDLPSSLCIKLYDLLLGQKQDIDLETHGN